MVRIGTKNFVWKLFSSTTFQTFLNKNKKFKKSKSNTPVAYRTYVALIHISNSKYTYFNFEIYLPFFIKIILHIKIFQFLDYRCKSIIFNINIFYLIWLIPVLDYYNVSFNWYYRFFFCIWFIILFYILIYQ